MALEDSAGDLQVVVPTITKGGDAIEDSMVTSSSIAQEEVAVEEVPPTSPRDVILSQSCL